MNIDLQGARSQIYQICSQREFRYHRNVHSQFTLQAEIIEIEKARDRKQGYILLLKQISKNTNK